MLAHRMDLDSLSSIEKFLFHPPFQEGSFRFLRLAMCLVMNFVWRGTKKFLKMLKRP